MPVKIICLIWIILVLILLSERILQLNKALKGKVALKLTEEGLSNYTTLKTINIPWNKIKGFQTGFYRTNSISINVSNLAPYRTIKIIDYASLIAFLNDIWSSKPYLLWIDIDMLAIKKAELLAILQHWKLYAAKKNQSI